MSRIFRFMPALLLLILPLAGCTGASLTSPTPSRPDQSGLETLPTIQHRLVDAEGKELDIWVRLLMISPDRRSRITLNGPCPPNCFHFQIEVGHLFVEGIQAYGTFQVGFGQTRTGIDTMLVGSAMIGQACPGGARCESSLAPTARIPSSPDQAWIFREVPPVLVVKGVSRICPPKLQCFQDETEIREGSWAFELEYR
jgi:hypothetical protein